MLNKSKITFNALSAIIQVVIVGVIYLILYKFVLTQLGIELLGVWSLIIATTSVASLANFGISSSIVKFVSTYHTQKRKDLIDKLIFTSIIFIVTTYSLISLLIYFLGTRFLYLILEEDYIDIATTLLPFSLLSLLINASSSVFNSAIDGIQKNYIKSYILIISSTILLLASIILTPKVGILGLVYAQVFQSIIVLFMTIYAFKRLAHFSFEFRWSWDKNIFKEIFNYGSKIQAASILEMTFEPITKFFLSKFGGLTMVGFYEMATRLIIQLRSLVVSATQVIIPVIAESKERNPDNINYIYTKLFSLIYYLSIVLTTLIVASAPIISIIWIGQYEKIFVDIVIISSIAMFFNISSTPAYFNFMGEGKLNWIVFSILISYSLNILLGYSFGVYIGGISVVIAFNVALIINALLLLRAFHNMKNLKLQSLISNKDLILAFGSILCMAISNHTFHSFWRNESSSLEFIVFLTSLGLFFYFLLRHKSFSVLKNLSLNLMKKIRLQRE